MAAPPPRDSTGLAAGLSVAVLLVLLAIAATIILVVSNNSSSNTAILTQPNVTATTGGAPTPAP